MKTLLLCVDGSAYGIEAAKYTAWLALKADARIIALYVSDLRQFEMPVVADLSGSLGIQPYQGIAAQLQEMEKEKAAVIERATMDALSAAGAGDRAAFAHKTGLLVDSVDQYRDEVDLVILGKRGENADFDKEHLGSMMERVVRSCHKPVWVTSRAYREINRLIFAYDGGSSCEKALAFLRESEIFKSLELHLVSVPEGKDDAGRAQKLEHAARSLTDAGYAVEAKLLEGEVERVIAEYVVKEGMDMLIMGAYGHSRIRYLLIGSTTTEMIRRCQIPVLCFR